MDEKKDTRKTKIMQRSKTLRLQHVASKIEFSSISLEYWLSKTPSKVLMLKPYDSLYLQSLVEPKDPDFVAFKHLQTFNLRPLKWAPFSEHCIMGNYTSSQGLINIQIQDGGSCILQKKLGFLLNLEAWHGLESVQTLFEKEYNYSK